MIELDARPNDHPDFLVVASRLIIGAAIVNRSPQISIARIDHWFGERWLGFCGKLFGIAGVRARNLTDELVVPPFHPHRVESECRYELIDGVMVRRDDPAWPAWHFQRSSHSNTRFRFYRCGMHAWFSGNTAETCKGVLMVYVIKKPKCAAWYTMFEPKPNWRLTHNVGISARKVREFMDCAEQQHAG